MIKQSKHEELHTDATDTQRSASHPRSQSPDSDQKPMIDPIVTKKAGEPTTRNSTGPRTASGKQRSSRNSLRDGLFSRVVVLERGSHAVYYSLVNELVKDLQPRGVLETELVESLASLLWRKRRVIAAEFALISEKMEFMASDSIASQFTESWNLSREPIASDGLLKNSQNRFVLREAIETLGLVKGLIAKEGV